MSETPARQGTPNPAGRQTATAYDFPEGRMGWWRIADGPGVPHYLGDAPWNVVEWAMEEVEQLLAGRPRLSESETLLLVRGTVPDLDAPKSVTGGLARVVADMWADLEECYWDVWGRGLLPKEKEALTEKAVAFLTIPSTIDDERLAELDALPLERLRPYLRGLRDEVMKGSWLRIEDRGSEVDITSVAAFDEWVTRRYPNAE